MILSKITKIFFIVLIFITDFICTESFALDNMYNSDKKERMFSSESYSISKNGLLSNGYDVNDINDIREAAFLYSENSIRECAIWFLAIKMGEDSIPIIKQALNDLDPFVRRQAALYLGFLGDRSGIQRMKQDMEELSQGGFDKISTESKAMQVEGPRALAYKNLRLDYALHAAQVLAELNDTSGFKLASQIALGGQFEAHRVTATWVLIELARLDKDPLKSKGIFPEIVLLDMIEKEENSLIINNIMVEAKLHMNPDTGNKIFEKINLSPRFSPELRKKAEDGIKELKKRIEKENKLKENEVTESTTN